MAWLFIGAACTLAYVTVSRPPEWLIGYVSGDTVVPLAVCFILVALSYFTVQILHKLDELNDQLAGRSSEFRDLLLALKRSRAQEWEET